MTTLADLVFDLPAPASADLVLGDFDPTGPLDETYLAVAIRGPGLSVLAKHAGRADVGVALGAPGLTVVGEYRSQTQRPLVGTVRSAWQAGAPSSVGVEARYQLTQATPVGIEARHAGATRTPAGVRTRWQNGARAHLERASRFQAASPVATPPVRVAWQEMDRRVRVERKAAWGPATAQRASIETGWQERQRDRRPDITTRWGEGSQIQRSQAMRVGDGKPLKAGWAVPWGPARRPPPGVRPPIVPPVDNPCYLPDGSLLFADLWTGSGDLVLFCELHDEPLPPALVVVPVRRVYIVQNNATLKRVDTDEFIPTFGFSLSLDADTWAWGFRASVPTAAQALVMPGSSGDPVLLEANVNGTPFRLLAERVSRERAFGRNSISVTGRGKTALLDAPYAATMQFSADEDRNALQLMDEALMVNGVPIGWSVDWGLTDWLVPGGVWSHRGTHISALNTIAAAAGGYLQPHDTDDVIRVLHRYPSAPWDWGSVSPDFELPAAVTLHESIEWVDKPIYDRIFVEGQAGGIRGQVTRIGYAGDLLAQPVVDPLITHAGAARQRGRAILSDTGRQATVGLRLPVLAETGVIRPGQFVRYLEGTTPMLGLVRSVSVEVSGIPEIWQTLGVQTHVL